MRVLLLHTNDEEARGPGYVQIQRSLTVVVVFLNGGEKVGQLGTQLHLYPGGGMRGSIRLLGATPKEQIEAVTLAAHLAGQGSIYCQTMRSVVRWY